MEHILLMGNEAVAYGAIDAGVSFVSGYPGTPSTEALETVARLKPDGVHVEWSVNEKVALEAAAGASYAGARALVTMKQVGLNVASDPLMSLNYVGVKGGLVILSADDPGPISSQTEQDTRRFAQFARLPVLDPSSPEEAYAMTRAAFELSELFRVPVLLRPTTRVCHACSAVERMEPTPLVKPSGFVKGKEWVIFPRLSYEAKKRIVAREPELAEAQRPFNKIDEINGDTPALIGVACGGIGSAYAREAILNLGLRCRILQIGAPNPFPEAMAAEFIDGLECVLVVEELDPVIEDGLRPLMNGIPLHGKRDGVILVAGELSAAIVESALRTIVPVRAINGGGAKESASARKPIAGSEDVDSAERPVPPVRPPVLCAGCPHRASFYAVKRAAKGRKAIFCGDIGCYTLGNAPPLDMVDTCLCMGAGVTVAQGLKQADPEAYCFAFIGDSTFFHSGMTGVLNAVYNRADMIVVVLDNRTTGMTGRQPHPGTGESAVGESAPEASIEAILRALGVASVRRANPFDVEEAIETTHEAMDEKGVRAIVFEAPCIAVAKPGKPMSIDIARCAGCQVCVKALGCPALSFQPSPKYEGRIVAHINTALCTGCGLCAQICPTECIQPIDLLCGSGGGGL
ncbi:MAG: indolepyruvate ferredoxin oxidoreductase subunit alpha [Oscillospiraceae bacterium]|nr:indolepyruvate ferredoxin oxidoreductase subunit alpha [Oscillospiraceae bacterium]